MNSYFVILAGCLIQIYEQRTHNIFLSSEIYLDDAVVFAVRQNPRNIGNITFGRALSLQRTVVVIVCKFVDTGLLHC